MKKNERNEYRQLVSDTLAYIKQEYPNPPPSRPAPQKKAEPPKEVKVQPPVPKPPIPKIEVEAKPRPQVQPPAEPMEELRRLIQKTAPTLPLHREIPSDELAQQVANRWKQAAHLSEVMVLSFGENGQSLAFLQNLARAIDIDLRPAELIDTVKMDKEKKWEPFFESESLKWIIAPSRSIGKSSELVRFYRENPATQERFLGNIPIFFLSPFQDYFKNPALKRSLWNTLCQMLKP